MSEPEFSAPAKDAPPFSFTFCVMAKESVALFVGFGDGIGGTMTGGRTKFCVMLPAYENVSPVACGRYELFVGTGAGPGPGPPGPEPPPPPHAEAAAMQNTEAAKRKRKANLL